MNRKPQLGDFVYAPVFGFSNSTEAARGVVSSFLVSDSERTLFVRGPNGGARCQVDGAIVIPPEFQTEEEKRFVEAVKA